MLGYVSAPRQLQLVRGNAGGGSIMRAAYQRTCAKQITTENIYENTIQQ
jgi:hypothetical protein